MKVSVIIPSYNHERYIRKTLASVLEQTLDDLEVIIVDDGSSDGSCDAVREMAFDSRIHLHTQKNSGTAVTLNRGISLARGDYIAVLNSDDLYHPDRLSRLLREMENNSGTGFVFSAIELVDEAGQPIIDGPVYEWLSSGRKYYLETNDLPLSLLKDNFACTSSNFMFRRDLVRKIGGFRDFRYVNDLAFLFRALRYTRCAFVDEPLLQYRVHSTNTIRERGVSGTDRDFLYELSWVAGLFLDDNPDMDRLDLHRLFSVLHDTHPITQETVLQCLMLQKRGIGFNDGKIFLDDYIKRNMEQQAYFVRIQEDIGKVMEANQKLSEEQSVLWGNYSELVGRHENLTDRHRFLKEQHDSLSQHSAEQDRAIEKLSWELGEKYRESDTLQKELARVWNERQDFALQLAGLLNSRRYRMASAVCDLACLRNVKFSMRELLKILLPESFKQRLKAAAGRLRGRSIVGDGLRQLKTDIELRSRTPVPVKNKKHKGPLVSIIVPCYNYGSYLDRMFDSLDKQTFQGYEIILVDDGSTDEFTLEKIRELEKKSIPNLHIHRQKNQGVITARNTAMKHAAGKYFFPLDPDDTIEKTFLEKCLLFLESSPAHYFVYTWTYSLGEPEFVWETIDTEFAGLLQENRAGFVVFPAQAFRETGGYNPVMQDGYEDWEFCVNLVRHGYVGKVIPEPLYQYYVKPGSRNDGAIQKHALLKKIINDLHQEGLAEQELLRKKEKSRRYIVDRPMINIVRPAVGNPVKTVMVDLYREAPDDPLTAFSRVLDLCRNPRQRVVVVLSYKWHFFFDLNVMDNLFVYYPENYHPDGDPGPLLEYLAEVYKPVAENGSLADMTPGPDEEDDRIGILFAAPWLITGGADSMIVDWFTHVDNGLFKKYFITTLPQTNTWLSKLKHHADEIYDLPALGCQALSDQEAFFLDFIEKKNIRILHIMNSTSAYSALPAIKERFPQVKTVSQFHCFDYLENGRRVGFPNDIPGRYDAYIDHYNIEYDRLRDDIIGIHPHVAPEKFVVVHGCIDTDLFDPAQVDGRKPDALRMGEQDAAFRILFIGRLDYQKQPLVMAALADELNRSGLEFVINVVGDGSIHSQKKELISFLKQKKLTTRVLLHGNQPLETLPLWYRNNDILLLTSLWEGVPMVLYQAMSMGLPCIAPDVGGVGELVQSGVTGELINDCNDVFAYRDAIIDMADNRKKLERLGRQAMELMRSRFSIQRMKSGYEAFYSTIAAVDASRNGEGS